MYRKIYTLILLGILLITSMPFQVHAEGEDTSIQQELLSQFNYKASVLNSIVDFTYNGEPFKTPADYLNSNNVIMTPLYLDLGDGQARFLKLGDLFENQQFSQAINIKVGNRLVKLSTLGDISLFKTNNSYKSYNSLYISKALRLYEKNLKKDRDNSLTNLIVAIDNYGNLVTNHKQILIPFYNNPIIIQKRDDYVVELVRGSRSRSFETSTDLRQGTVKENLGTSPETLHLPQDFYTGYVFSTLLNRSGNVNDLLEGVLPNRNAFTKPILVSEEVKAREMDQSKVFFWDFSVLFPTEKERVTANMMDNFGRKDVKEFSEADLKASPESEDDPTNPKANLTTLSQIVGCYGGYKFSDNDSPIADYCSGLFGANHDLGNSVKSAFDDSNNKFAVESAIVSLYGGIVRDWNQKTFLEALKKSNTEPFLYSPVANTFGDSTSGYTSLEGIVDEIQMQKDIWNKLSYIMNFGFFNLLKMTYTAIGDDIYENLILKVAGNTIFYTPEPSQVPYLNIAVVTLYILLVAVGILKIVLDILRVSYGKLLMRDVFVRGFWYFVIFVAPIFMYSALVGLTFNWTTDALSEKELTRMAVLDRAVQYNREFLSTNPELAKYIQQRKPIERYNILIKTAEENADSLDTQNKRVLVALKDFLAYARNKSIYAGEAKYYDQQAKQGFMEAKLVEDNLFDYLVRLQDPTDRKYYRKFEKKVVDELGNERSVVIKEEEYLAVEDTKDKSTQERNTRLEKASNIFTDFYKYYMLDLPAQQEGENAYLSKLLDYEISNQYLGRSFKYQDGDELIRDLGRIQSRGNGKFSVDTNEISLEALKALVSLNMIENVREGEKDTTFEIRKSIDGEPVVTEEELTNRINSLVQRRNESKADFGINTLIEINSGIDRLARRDVFHLGIDEESVDIEACLKQPDSACGMLLWKYSPVLIKEGMLTIEQGGKHFTPAGKDRFDELVYDLNKTIINKYQDYFLIFSSLDQRDDLIRSENEVLTAIVFFEINKAFDIETYPKGLANNGTSTDTFLKILFIPMPAFSPTNVDVNNTAHYIGMQLDFITFMSFIILAFVQMTVYGSIKLLVISLAFPFLILFAAVVKAIFSDSKAHIGLAYIFGVFYIAHLCFVLLWKGASSALNALSMYVDWYVSLPHIVICAVFIIYFIILWKFALLPMFKMIKNNPWDLGGWEVLRKAEQVKSKFKDFAQRSSDWFSNEIKGQSQISEDDVTSTENTAASYTENSREVEQNLRPKEDPIFTNESNILSKELDNFFDDSKEIVIDPNISGGDIVIPEISGGAPQNNLEIDTTSLQIDSPEARELSKEFYENLGYTVNETEDGLEILGATSEQINETLHALSEHLQEHGLDYLLTKDSGIALRRTEDDRLIESLEIISGQGVMNDTIVSRKVLEDAEDARLISDLSYEDGKITFKNTSELSDSALKEHLSKTAIAETFGDFLEFTPESESIATLNNNQMTREIAENLLRDGLIESYNITEDGKISLEAAKGVSLQTLESISNELQEAWKAQHYYPEDFAALSQGAYVTAPKVVLDSIMKTAESLEDSFRSEVISEIVPEYTSDAPGIFLKDTEINKELLRRSGITSFENRNGSLYIPETAYEALGVSAPIDPRTLTVWTELSSEEQSELLEKYQISLKESQEHLATLLKSKMISAASAPISLNLVGENLVASNLLERELLKKASELVENQLGSRADDLMATAKSLDRHLLDRMAAASGEHLEDSVIISEKRRVSEGYAREYTLKGWESELKYLRDLLRTPKELQDPSKESLIASAAALGITAESMYKAQDGSYRLITNLRGEKSTLESLLNQLKVTPNYTGEGSGPSILDMMYLAENPNAFAGSIDPIIPVEGSGDSSNFPFGAPDSFETSSQNHLQGPDNFGYSPFAPDQFTQSQSYSGPGTGNQPFPPQF